MNGNNAFTKSWEFINVTVQYIFARYREAGSKMSASFDPEWNAKMFFAGLSELVYLTALIIFALYLIFRGFGIHGRLHSMVLVTLIGLAGVTCIG